MSSDFIPRPAIKAGLNRMGAEEVSMHNRVISLGSWETTILLFDLQAHKK